MAKASNGIKMIQNWGKNTKKNTSQNCNWAQADPKSPHEDLKNFAPQNGQNGRNSYLRLALIPEARFSGIAEERTKFEMSERMADGVERTKIRGASESAVNTIGWM